MTLPVVLIWNERNIAHIARHRVIAVEVEQVVYGIHVKRGTYDGRIAIIGKTDTGRMLYIVVFPQSQEEHYVVTARSADKKERALFDLEMKQGGEGL